MASDKLMTVADTAATLRVSTKTVRRLIWDRRIPSVRIGRAVRVRETDLVRIINECRESADPDKALPGAIDDEDCRNLIANIMKPRKQGANK